jgi:C_GCAxxG_C_C family probable redox protein
METIQHHLKPSCTKKCNRRSFIVKSIYTSLGIGLNSSLLVAASTPCSSGKKQDEEIFKVLDELVDKYLPIFGTCSQTSFYALNEAFNLKAEKFVKALAPFPGIALRGETCGAVSGCLSGIALVYEDDDIFNEEKHGLSLKPSFTFCSKFEMEYGSTRCRDVIENVTGKKYNVAKPDDYDLLRQEGVYSNCPSVIKKAVHIAAEIILAKSKSIY